MKERTIGIISATLLALFIGIINIGWDTSGGFPPGGSSSQYLRGDRTWQILNKNTVSLGNVENTALSTWAGSTNLVSLGTITSGTIGDAYISSSSTWNNKAAAGTNTDITSLGACNSVTSSASNLTLSANGTNKNIVLSPTGSGGTVIGTSTLDQKVSIQGGMTLTNVTPLLILNDVSTAGSGNEQSQITMRKNGSNVGKVVYEHSDNSFRIYINGNPGTQVFVATGTGTIRMPFYGAGTATFLADGTLTSVSDEMAKNILGSFNASLGEILNINPILYKHKPETGLDPENIYAGFSAQDVLKSIPEAIGLDSEGKHTFNDRPVIAALVNAIKELQKEIDILKAKNGIKVDDYKIPVADKHRMIVTKYKREKQLDEVSASEAFREVKEITNSFSTGEKGEIIAEEIIRPILKDGFCEKDGKFYKETLILNSIDN